MTMTTNDPQEKYEQKRHLIDMMHDDAKDGLYEQPKREPPVIDIKVFTIFGGTDYGEDYDISGEFVRLDDLQDAIAAGRLKVMDDAGWARDEHGREVCSICLSRSKESVSGGKPPLPLQWTLRSNGLPFCPLCGNSTRR